MAFEGAYDLEDEGEGGNKGKDEGTSRPNEDHEDDYEEEEEFIHIPHFVMRGFCNHHILYQYTYVFCSYCIYLEHVFP